MSEETLQFKGTACNAVSEGFYSNFLRFRHQPQQRIDRQLASVGLSPERLRGIVFTHRHADHSDGLRPFSLATQVYVGSADWPAHAGALPCRWQEGRALTLVDSGGEPFGAFASSTPLSADGRVRIVPLPGHSPGHLGLMVALLDGQYLLFAGDSLFRWRRCSRAWWRASLKTPAPLVPA